MGAADEHQTLWSKIYSPMVLSLALRNLKLNKFRTALSMIGIVIGVFAICGLGMVGAAFTVEINNMVADQANTLTISSIEEKSIDGRIVKGLSEKDINDIESAVKPVSSEYQVIKALMGTKMIRVGSDTSYAMVMGEDPDGLKSYMEGNLKDGSIPKGPGGVIILEEYAEKHDLHVNSRLSATGVNGEDITLRVTGIMESTTMTKMLAQSSDVCMLFGTLDMYHNLLGSNDDLYTYAIVKVKDPLLLTPMEDAIVREMNGKSYKDSDDKVKITNSYDNVESLNDVLNMTAIFRWAISSVSLVVAAVAIVNVMLMSVKERTREIGILRSIGTKRIQILQMFLYEAGIIGLIGSLIGIILSAFVVPPILIALMDNLNALLDPTVFMYIPGGILIGVGVCVIAGLYPAMHAANLNPVEAMATD
ncbi:MAG TPA: ABC transporter permease [Methanocorpusculum sp.]|nr:ABC transporter permease [Methanocorpusculum sp.]